MKRNLTSTNLLEVAYLLNRHHHIKTVAVKPGRYGVNELEVTLEGDNINLDRGTFWAHSGDSLEGLPQVLEQVSLAVQVEQERRLV